MAVQRRARQLTGEDEMDEVGQKDDGSFILSWTWSGGDESCLASVRGLWREKEGQVSMAGFFTRADEKAWQYKSSQKASQCVSASCPAGISFMALQRVHSEVNLIRTVQLVKK